MSAGWVTYCVLVAVLLGIAAWLGERAVRARGWPGRWTWGVALAASLGLPLWAWLVPVPGGSASASAVPLPGAYLMEALPPLLPAVGSAGPSLEAVLLAGWALSSAVLLLYLAAGALRVRAAGRRWRRGEVDGVEVLVSERTGPAALGLVRGRVVLPEWALGLDERLRRLLVLHEAEHVRAKDPQLAVAGLLACALMPWNPALWWQRGRLRLAIEVDCDARVLRQANDASGYGALLLEVGQRRARLALGLVESRSMLERRIRMMTRTERGRTTLRAVGLGAVAVLFLAVACETPGPMGADDSSGEADRSEAAAPSASQERAADGPVSTPMTEMPSLRNADDVREALLRHYPPLLRNAGIGGTTHLWLYIDKTGVVTRVQVHRGSGYDALDQAALRLADLMRFEPARNGDEVVPAWVSVPVTFEVQ